MANNYLQFSAMLESTSPEEHKWMERYIEIANKWAELDDDFRDDPRYPDFGNELYPSEGLHIYAEDYGNVDSVAIFVQSFLNRWRPDGEFFMGYAWTCSKMRVGEFGGGRIKVTANGWHACDGSCVDNWIPTPDTDKEA